MFYHEGIAQQPSRPLGDMTRRARTGAVAVLLALGSPALAEIYRWTDDSGSVHFSDSLHGVPERYRKQVQTRPSELPPSSPAPAERRPPVPAAEIPLERHASGYIVEARFNNAAAARLIVDTGATSTLISSRFANRLGLVVRRDPPVILRTAGGQVEAGWAEVQTIDVGGKRSGPLKVVVHDALEDADGLLGMNFLGAYRVEIYAQRPSLILSAP